mgnify:CR=1 FL=1
MADEKSKRNFCSLVKTHICGASTNGNYAECEFFEGGANSICKHVNGHLCNNIEAQKADQKRRID